MQTYKVEREAGIDIDGVEFNQGAILELDSETILVSDMLADGSIVPVDVDADEAVTPTENDTEVSTSDEEDVTPTDDDEDVNLSNDEDEEAPEVPTETNTFYNGQKITGEVQDVEIEGVVHKKFSIESGETFTLTVEEFNASTTTS